MFPLHYRWGKGLKKKEGDLVHGKLWMYFQIFQDLSAGCEKQSDKHSSDCEEFGKFPQRQEGKAGGEHRCLGYLSLSSLFLFQLEKGIRLTGERSFSDD